MRRLNADRKVMLMGGQEVAMIFADIRASWRHGRDRSRPRGEGALATPFRGPLDVLIAAEQALTSAH
jgi:hypothetical protein